MHFHFTKSGKRRIIGVMVYSFARVAAVVGMNVEGYSQQGKRWGSRLHEKGGKRHEVPAHHNAKATSGIRSKYNL